MINREIPEPQLSDQEQLNLLRKEERKLARRMKKFDITDPDQFGYVNLFQRLNNVRFWIDQLQHSIVPDGPSPTTQDYTATEDPQGRRRWYKPRRSR